MDQFSRVMFVPPGRTSEQHLVDFGPKLAESYQFSGQLFELGQLSLNSGHRWPMPRHFLPNAGQIWQISCQLRRIRPNLSDTGQHFGKCWPNVAEFGSTSIESGLCLADSGRNSPIWVEFVPTSGRVGPNSANLDPLRPVLSRHRPGFDQPSANSTGFGPIWANLGLLSNHFNSRRSGTLIQQRRARLRFRSIWG